MTAIEPIQAYRIERAHGVADLDRTEWNDVVSRADGSVFHTWEFLSAFEEAPPGSFQPAHLLAYAGPRLVGVCPAYLVHQCPRLDHLLALGALDVGGPILLAHSLAGFAGGPLAVPDHPAAADALITGLEQTAGELGAWAWGIANLPASPLVGRLLGAGYAVAQVADTHLVETAAFAAPPDYWAAMTSRRRRTLSRERRVRSDGLHFAEAIPDIDTLVRLVHATLRAHKTPIDVLPKDFLHALRRHLAAFERTLAITDDHGETAAVFVGWQFGAEWSLWMAGLETDRFTAFEPYHPAMAHAIEAAITARTPRVNLGRGNAPVKRRYGATGTPLFLALSCADRSRNALLHAWCGTLETRSRESADGLEVVSRCC